MSGVRVLVIDDEPDSQAITEFALEQAGATVVLASSGAEALNIFRREPPDFLISDIGMPDMDGYELMQQIRAFEQAEGKMGAITLTAYAGEGDRQQAEASGFQRHLTKPIDPDALVRMVCETMRLT